MIQQKLPRHLGDYKLLRRIAVGGMAEVYEATAPGLGGFEKYVAIKVIHPRYATDSHFVNLLVDEAKITVQLTHSNIAQIFDLSRIDETIFIVMEYVDGPDSFRLMRAAHARRVRLSPELCVHIMAQVCAGLEYAHRKLGPDGLPLQVVHRDISPQNILLSRSGEVKIVDFGIAKATGRSTKTEAGVIKGKYYYMAPEQAWGDPVDGRSDIFSAGIVLHELLTGRMVYKEENLPKLMDKVRKADIRPPSSKRKNLPKRLDEIVMRAVAKSPDDRYQTAYDMAHDLREYLYQAAPGFSANRLADVIRTLLPPKPRRASSPDEAPDDKKLKADEFVPNRSQSVVFGKTQAQGSSPAAQLGGEETDDDDHEEVSLAQTVASGPAWSAADEQQTRVESKSFDELQIAPDAVVKEHQLPRPAGIPVSDAPPQPDGQEPRLSPAPDPFARSVNPPPQSPGRGQGRVTFVAFIGIIALLAVGVGYGLSSSLRCSGQDVGGIDLISVPPGATVIVNGVETPAPTPTRVVPPPSENLQRSTRVVLQLAGYEDWTYTHPPGGPAVQKVAVLLPATRNLLLSSQPSGAAVRIMNRPRGTTPVELNNLPLGRPLMVTLTLDGYERRSVPITLEAGSSPEEIELRLTPINPPGTSPVNSRP